ncbi:MAG: NTP transferase domain-containing protein [Actinomycetota bacterium]
MAKLRAAVLAAGRGVRMGGDRPKTLISVGDHEPMLHYLLRGLRAAGVDDLMVITGFMHEAVTAYVAERWGDDQVSYVFNPRYASWGNFHSARLAADQSPGFDLMIVNCDIVIHPDVFKRVVSTEGDLVLAVEQRYGLDKEDMRVRVDGGRVTDIGKDLEMQFSVGEFCGVSLMRGAAQTLYRDLATSIEWQRSSSIYYEDIYKQMLGHVEARAAEVRPGEYAEIDTPEDVRTAIDVIERHRAAFNDSSGQPQPA